MLSNRTTLRIIVFGCVDSQMICTDLETYQHFVELVLMTILVFPDTTVCLYVDDIISICSMRRLKFSVPHRPNANAHGHDGGFSECCATSQLGTSWMRGTDDPVRETKRVKKIAFCRHVICSYLLIHSGLHQLQLPRFCVALACVQAGSLIRRQAHQRQRVLHRSISIT